MDDSPLHTQKEVIEEVDYREMQLLSFKGPAMLLFQFFNFSGSGKLKSVCFPFGLPVVA